MIFINGLRVRVGNEFVNGCIDPYNPLGLPNNTIRVKFKSGYTPDMGDTQILVDSSNNVWDIYKQSNMWVYLFGNRDKLLEVLGANTSNVTDMSYMFDNCTSLRTVTLFNTSNVTDMSNMFYLCAKLTRIPLFNTSNVTNMYNMFSQCIDVESGALALYKQASTQTNPPTNHGGTFYMCGSSTQTGRAELAQIPNDWK